MSFRNIAASFFPSRHGPDRHRALCVTRPLLALFSAGARHDDGGCRPASDGRQFDALPPKLFRVELTNVPGEDSIAEVFDRLSRPGYTLHHRNLDETLAGTLDPVGLPAGSTGKYGFAHTSIKQDRPDMFRGK